MVWFLELWVRSRNNIALPSPTDDTHLEFYFEQAGNIQRSFGEKKHTMLEMRPCHTVSRYIQFSSVTQLCPTLCYPMDHSTPGLSVHHQLLEFTQTHVHWVGDAIQPSHPLSSPSPPALNLSQHQGLFQWVSSLHQVAKVLEFQL